MTYLFTICVTESCDSPDWLIQYCLSSASSRVTETVHVENVFKNVLVQTNEQYDQSMAEYRNTYHCYDLATQYD